MAEHDQNDEYKFVEFDNLDNEMMEEEKEPIPNERSSTSFIHSGALASTDIKRNALIAVGVIILLILMYKVIGYLFFNKKETVSVKPSPAPVTQTVAQPIVTPAPIPQPIQQPVITVNTSDLTQKVSAVEIAQQSVKDEVNSMNQQVSAVNNNINNLNNEIASLNQVITTLSNQLAKQSDEINVLMQRTQPKHIIKHISKPTTPPLIYYIQAVIPGRAWLIGTNGSTLTVREGTKIAGYGVVKLIDSLEGRVVTSSGTVIRFSQDDS